MSRPEDKNRTRIAIDLPLPMDVAGTVMKLIGTAYPSATIDASQGYGRQMVMLVDDSDRKRLPGKRRVADEIKDYQPDLVTAEADLTKVSQDDEGHLWISTAPTEELCLYLGSICAPIIGSHPDAVNYMEWQVLTPGDEPDLVLSVARSKGQTPDAMRKKAETKIASALALADEWEIAGRADEATELRALLGGDQ